MAKRIRYTPEFKQQVVEFYKANPEASHEESQARAKELGYETYSKNMHGDLRRDARGPAEAPKECVMDLKTGRLKKLASAKESTKTGSLSHRTVRLPSGSIPGRVLANSAETATRWRIGFRPAILIVTRKHWASSPRLAVIASIPGASMVKQFCSMTAAQMAPTSESPPMTEMRCALLFPLRSISPMRRSSLTLIRVVVSFVRFVYSKTPKRSWAFFMEAVLW